MHYMPAADRPYVSVSLSSSTRDRLRAVAVRLTSPVGRTLTLSEVTDALIDLSERYEGELVRTLRGES